MHPTIPSLLSVTGLLCLACCVERTFAGDPNITWITPSDGDVYSSGDTIVGRWSSDKAVVSPSFRICVTDDGSGAASRRDDADDADDDEDGAGTDDKGDSGEGDDGDTNGSGDSDSPSGSCGAAVWPTIEQSDGSYFVHMSLPNVSSVASCFLEMVDDFGHKMASPTFSYGAATDDMSSSEAADPSSSSAAAADASSTPSSTPNNSSSPTPPTPTPNVPQTFSLDESRAPVPTAAYAVPLSLVASVLLAAGGLSVHQRRKLQSERKQEQESLKTRGALALSRHSTLSFAGFTKLGSGRRPPTRDSSRGQGGGGGQESRSTSVNMMRAWRRDVSRHERRPECASRASETTLAWRTDDGRSRGGSVGGEGHYTAFPHREPRRPTREPFHASHAHGQGRARRTMVPARDFRAGVSPVFPSTDSWGGSRSAHDDRDKLSREYDEEEEEDWGRLKHKGRTLVDPGVADHSPHRSNSYLNASVNDSVLDRYIAGSPVPPSPEPRYREHSPPSVSRPERLHVRRYAEAGGEERVVPVARDSERDLYDTVARKISRSPHP